MLNDQKLNQHKYTVIAWCSCCVLVLGQFGTDLYLPSLPAITDSLNTTADLAQLTLTAFLVGYAISQPVYGPLSDGFGRKKLLLTGLSIYFFMSILLVFSFSITTLIVCRFMQGVGAGAASVIPRAIIRDLFTGKELEKVSSLQSTMWSCVPIVAPVIGGYIQHYLGWRWQFCFLALLSGTGVLLVYHFISETNPGFKGSVQIKNIISSYIEAARNRRLVCNVIAMGATGGMMMTFLTAAPFMFQGLYHINAVVYGWLILLMAGGLIVGSLFNRFLLTKFSAYKINGVVKMLNLSLLIALSIYVGFYNPLPHLIVITLSFFLMFFFASMLYPNAAACAMQSINKNIGAATAFLTLMASVFFSSSTAIVASLPKSPIIYDILVLLGFSVLIVVGCKCSELLNKY